MKDITLLKKIKDIIKTTKEDFDCLKNEYKFEDAISYFDVEVLKDLVANGFNVFEYEKNTGSTLHRAMCEFDNKMLSIFKKYDGKLGVKYYYNTYPNFSKFTFNKDFVNVLENNVKSLVDIMEFLYQNGADINNRNMYITDDSSIFSTLTNQKEINMTTSPFAHAIALLDYFKSTDVIEWFFSKNEFNIKNESDVISILMDSNSKLSKQVLNELLENGLEVRKYNITERTKVLNK